MEEFHAHFDGEDFVPDEPVNLPEGTQVTVSVVNGPAAPADLPLEALARLADEHAIADSPPDWSAQHNHYIHGTPKR